MERNLDDAFAGDGLVDSVSADASSSPVSMQTAKALWDRVEGLEELQKQKLWWMMEHHYTIFATSASDVGETKLVQHCINTGDAPPIRQHA